MSSMQQSRNEVREELGIEEAKEIVRAMHSSVALPRSLPPLMFWSSPGVGKTDVMSQLAREDEAEMITLRASELAPHELVGLPALHDEGFTRFSPLYELFRLTKAANASEKNRKWLFLDEFTNAQPDMMASYQYLVLNRVLGGPGGLELGDNVRIVAAGNYETDRAFTHSLSTALRSRFLHVHLRPRLKEWLTWARAQGGVQARILAFLQQNESRFHDFDPERDDDSFPCPRTWTMLSDALTALDAKKVTNSRIRRAIILGTVGKGAGAEYHRFEQVAIHAPTRDQIAEDPNGTPVFDSQPDVALVAIENLLAAIREDPDHYTDPAILYVARMHREYRTLFAQAVLNLHRDMPTDALECVLQSKHFHLLQDCIGRMHDIMAETAA